MIWGPDPNAAKTFIVQFIYQDGNGWAFVNAPTVTLAQKVFKEQTIYKGARVINVKETKYYGNNTQLVFEGAVTTLKGGFDILELLEKSDWLNKVQEIVDDSIKEYNKTVLDKDKELNNKINVLRNDLNIGYYNKAYINQQLENLTLEIIKKQDKLTIDTELNEESTNPVTNAAITTRINELAENQGPQFSYFYNDIEQTLIIQ